MKVLTSENADKSAKRNYYRFSIDQERSIEISSDFQNGNINLVKQIHQLYYVLEAVGDGDQNNSRKAWFHFKIKSSKGIKVKFLIQNVNIYDSIFEEREMCRPFMKDGINGQWRQSSESFITFQDDVVMVIDHTFKSSEEVFFCLTLPFTYTDNQRYIQSLKSVIPPGVDYRDQILATTLNNNNVHLITITEKKKKAKIRNQQKKPVVLITSRVHPGEVSSSYCMQGIIEFLLDRDNLQAFLLRKLFVFKIIPMLNPDGVIEGNYRMDIKGVNLNRVYYNPTKQEHPQIYELSELIKRISENQKIQFYFDLHSHSSLKDSFIYGNAFDDIVQQTYSELYCKILEQNYTKFKYSLCNFGQKHMKHRDKGQTLTKQGCGRVVISRRANVTQSYTVETGIFTACYYRSAEKNHRNAEKNTQFIYQNYSIKAKGTISQQVNARTSIIIIQNRKLGRSILISILDMIKKNPYTRLNEDFSESFCRQLSAKLLQNQERFKLLDPRASNKVKNINKFIKINFEDKLNCQLYMAGISNQINAVEWPPQVKKIGSSLDQIEVKSQKKVRLKTDCLQKLSSKLDLMREKKLAKQSINSHRSISPINRQSDKNVFPEIKYSIQLKSIKGKMKNREGRVTAIKELQFDFKNTNSGIQNIKKRVVLEYIHEQISKINPDKVLLRKNNSSLNRIIVNRILDRDRQKSLNDHTSKVQLAIESRKIIELEDNTNAEDKNNRCLENEEVARKQIEDKAFQVQKKRLLTNGKLIEIVRKHQKNKLKFPDITKINLIVENAKKSKRMLTSSDCCQTYGDDLLSK